MLGRFRSLRISRAALAPQAADTAHLGRALSTDILLIEDDQRLADLTAEYFRQNGLTVAVESRGYRAESASFQPGPSHDLLVPGG